MAVNCWVVLWAMVAEAGSTVSDCNSGFTISVTNPAGALVPDPSVAVIMVTPTALAVANPAVAPPEVMVTAPELDEVQVTLLVMLGGLLPSLMVPVAVNWRVSPV